MRTLAELVCDDDCPVRRSMDVLGGRWTLLIVRDLLVEPRRFGELLMTLGGVSPKVLTDRLKSLEREGILTRTVYPVMPLRVEYALTDLGRELRPVIDALAAWGERLPAGERPAGVRAADRETGAAGPAISPGWPPAAQTGR